MRYSMKIALALLIALLLALSTFTSAEGFADGVAAIDDVAEAVDEAQLIASHEAEPPVEEAGDLAPKSPDEAAEGAADIAETNGFSRYTVEFYYNQMEYVMPGDSSVALSEILAALGMSGEVTEAAVSDDSLFSVSDESGQWLLTAHRPFSTTEWMQVTIDGVLYQITVTDDE